MAFRFEELKIWQQAFLLSNQIERSGIEVVSCLFMARARNYITEEQFKKYYSDYEILVKMITKFRDSLH